MEYLDNPEDFLQEIKAEFIEIYKEFSSSEQRDKELKKLIKKKANIKYPEGAKFAVKRDINNEVLEYVKKNLAKTLTLADRRILEEDDNTDIQKATSVFGKQIDFKKRGKRTIKKTDGNSVMENDLSNPNLSIDASAINLKDDKDGSDLFDTTVMRNNFNSVKDTIEDETVVKNVEMIIDEIEGAYEDKSLLEFKIVDIDVSYLLGNKKLKDISKRGDIYQFWKDMSPKFADLHAKILELTKLIEPLQESKDEVLAEDAKAFVELIGGFDKDSLNYISTSTKKTYELADVYERADRLITNFLTEIRALSALTDETDIELIYDKVQDSETGEEKEMREISDIMSAKDAISNTESKPLLEDIDLDPLAILYLKDEMDEIVDTFNDVNFVETVEEFFLSIKDEVKEILDGEDTETTLNKLKATIKSIDKLDETTFSLPFEIFKEPALRDVYSSEVSRAGEKRENIQEFLRLFAELLEEEKTLFDYTTYLDMTGKGTKDSGFQYRAYEKYMKTTLGRRGMVRASKEITEDMKTLFKEISEMIGELFLEPIHSKNTLGVALPFAKDGHLRIIVSTQITGEKYQAYRTMNDKIVDSQSRFIKPRRLKRLLPFLKSVNSGEIFTAPKESEKKAESFVNALSEIYRGKSSIKQQIKKDVASIFGGLESMSSGKKILDKFMGLDTSDAFRSRGVDDVDEMTPIRILIDTLREKQEVLETENKPLYEQTLEFLKQVDRIAKSSIYSRILEAHDSLRILKGKEIFFAKRNEEDFDDVDAILQKMETKYNVDMSASELVSIVNEIDSFDSISKAYGINSEHVYFIKANFR